MKQRSNEYCSFCGRRTPHVKDYDEQLCKRCGRKQKRLNVRRLLG